MLQCALTLVGNDTIVLSLVPRTKQKYSTESGLAACVLKHEMLIRA
jgi:hypothetical protein